MSLFMMLTASVKCNLFSNLMVNILIMGNEIFHAYLIKCAYIIFQCSSDQINIFDEFLKPYKIWYKAQIRNIDCISGRHTKYIIYFSDHS